MRLYEFEGKRIFRKQGIPTPKSIVLNREDDIESLQVEYPVMVKAQVLQGGRGKAGLIKAASNPEELKAYSIDIFSKIGEDECILLEEKLSADYEAYIGVTVNDVEGIAYIVISKTGGMDIETVAKENPEAIIKIPVSPTEQLPYHSVLAGAKKAGFRGPILPKVADIAYKLYTTFVKYELDLIEINPLLIIGEYVVAGDSKVIADDYVIDRYEEFKEIHASRDKVDNDVKAMYVPLEGGRIGVISYGASSTMMTIDSIMVMGGKPANFADIAGGADADTIYDLSKTILIRSDERPEVKVVLITLTLVAHSMKLSVDAIIKAVNEIKPKVALVANVRAAGAAKRDMDVDAAAAVFKENGIIWCDTLEEAIDTCINISKE